MRVPDDVVGAGADEYRNPPLDQHIRPPAPTDWTVGRDTIDTLAVIPCGKR
jgi:hypothetical protein